MSVDKWFASLDRDARKKVLGALQIYRQMFTGIVESVHIAKNHWVYLEPLLRLLDDAHYELKPENRTPSSYHQRVCNLCESSAAQHCVAPS